MGYVFWKLLQQWYRRFPPAPVTSSPAPLELTHLDSFAEYQTWMAGSTAVRLEQRRFEQDLLRRGERFTLAGTCQACQRRVPFLIDYRHAAAENGRRTPNWRESCICAVCVMNNRTRASMHIFQQLAPLADTAAIYVTEAVTPQFRWLRARRPNTIGSEYFGVDHVGGSSVNGVRHEDLTQLSFAEQTFDAVLSFDVLEHVPDYLAALKECFRVLKPGGLLLLSAPFVAENPQHTVRARLQPDGSVEHLLPPEYHGDPLQRSNGCLAFYHFGWEILDELRAIGFETAASCFYWSAEFCYLGDKQMILYARKGGAAL